MPTATALDIYCPNCGYNLRGLPSPRCPECGSAVDLTAASPVIPWRHRQRIGRIRAYLATLWTIIFRTGRIKNEVNAPTGYRDARRFWLITMAIAYLPCPLITLALLAAYDRSTSLLQIIQQNQYGIDYAAAAVNLGVIFFLLAATSLPSYFVMGRQMTIVRQNRAIAISYYGCAAWVFAPVAVGACFLGPPRESIFFWIFGASLCLAIIVVWYLNTLRLLRIATARRGKSALLMAVALPLAWIVLAVFLIAVFPFLLYTLLILLSAW